MVLVNGGSIMPKLPRLTWFALLGLVFCLGCAASVHKYLDPQVTQTRQPTEVVSSVPPEEVSIYVSQASGTGEAIAAGGGVCCMVVGEMVRKQEVAARSKKAEEWIAPLLQQTPDVDFRRDFWDALSPTLEAIPWLEVTEIQNQTTLGAMPAGGVRPKDLPAEGSLLLLQTGYNFSSDFQALVATTMMHFWPPQAKEAAYFGTMIYSSPRIDDREEVCSQFWSENGAALYRQEMGAAIAGTMEMIRLELADPAASQAATQRPVDTMKFKVPIDGPKVKLKGWIVSEDPARVIFREERGTLYSLAVKDVEAHK